MKELTYLLKSLKSPKITGNTLRNISSIEFDTRAISSQSPEAVPLYVAQRGTRVDGHQFIERAIEQGAGVVVCEVLPDTLHPHVTYIEVSDASVALGFLADAFYGHPSSKLKLVGITGTNGKTTTVTLLYRLFTRLGYKTGLLSTIENIIDGEVLPAKHTTPDAVNINKMLERMVSAGCEYCFMEVSSHAIVQHRIQGLHFTGGIFSNITHDHLDFHKTFIQYIHAKKAFFDQLPPTAFALTNKDDRNGLVMVENTKANVKTYSLTSPADFKGKLLDNSFDGLHMLINDKEAYFHLTGRFNAYNLLAIYGTAVLLGLSEEEALIEMSALESAAGRFQLIKNDKNSKAIVDYAHTPDALKNVLSTIHDIVQNSAEIITVLGSGGERDALKRPLMAKTACKYSNKVILTSDNPRSEDPYLILADMEAGVPVEYRHHVLVIENRKEAIKAASMMLQDGGVLLVAGKGHENYQEINGTRYHFDDLEVVKEFFNL